MKNCNEWLQTTTLRSKLCWLYRFYGDDDNAECSDASDGYATDDVICDPEEQQFTTHWFYNRGSGQELQFQFY